jgi:hypothetical protein
MAQRGFYPGETSLEQLDSPYRWAPETTVAYFNRAYPSGQPRLCFEFREASGGRVRRQIGVLALEGARRCTLMPQAAYLRFVFEEGKATFDVLLLDGSGDFLDKRVVPVRVPALLEEVLKARFDPGPSGVLMLSEYDSWMREQQEGGRSAQRRRVF